MDTSVASFIDRYGVTARTRRFLEVEKRHFIDVPVEELPIQPLPAAQHEVTGCGFGRNCLIRRPGIATITVPCDLICRRVIGHHHMPPGIR